MLPNTAGVTGVRVTEANRIGNDVDVLIGMDIITLGDFAVTTYNGKTTFSFRMPSLTEIDFVKEIESQKGKAKLTSAIKNALKKPPKVG
ncbi:MAG: hypothetical protein BMS9Abin15_0226 [Gammaproteobacteria bacterium]|nr:MAG: hypothetical protein BMS9Abin15_0226 [Gammaproteobacteria bacterium]